MLSEEQIKLRIEYLKGYYKGISEGWSHEEDIKIKAQIEVLEEVLKE